MVQVNTLIVGGGAAGLWLLDTLGRRGIDALVLEANALGAGQTIASQGIIHGGVKYSLLGSVTGSARAIRRMPELWRRCLAGEAKPDLSATRLRAEHCHLWHTAGMGSRLGFTGARKALQITPTELSQDQRPEALAQLPGKVLRLDEQVISPQSFLQTLAHANAPRILSCAPPIEMDWQCGGQGRVKHVRLDDPRSARSLEIEPRHVVLTAGQGNAELRQTLGLDRSACEQTDGESHSIMQRRPLHMITARGRLPLLNGHCIDGQKTRLTITSESEHAGSTQTQDANANPPVVWQIGGQVSEVGVEMEPDALIGHTQEELNAVLPTVDTSGAQWSTYRVDRAEAKMPAGVRPENAWAKPEANVITAWPTKLALVPELTRIIHEMIEVENERYPESKSSDDWPDDILNHWPRPNVSRYPWEN